MILLLLQGIITMATYGDEGVSRVVEETPEIVSTILPDLEMLPEVHTNKPSWLLRRTSPMQKDNQPEQLQPVRDPVFESKTNKVLLHLL